MSNYLKVLCGIFIAAVIWSAVKPLSGSNWLLEMLPVMVALPLIIYFGNRYKISELSYALMLIYLLMLVAQAHFGVGFVPIGKKLAPLFDTERNVFDRITHFFSGLLWFYPLYEIVRQGVSKRDFLDYMIPAMLIMGLGAVYEVAEFIAFKTASPRLAFLFIGAQSDAYDSSKDLTMALIGTIIGGTAVFIIKKFQNQKRMKR